MPVRGGLHEVDLLRRRMRCVYWPDAAHRISRGTWFVEKAPDWVPLKVRRTSPLMCSPVPRPFPACYVCLRSLLSHLQGSILHASQCRGLRLKWW